MENIANKITNPIYWYESMLVGPKHFQKLSLRYEQLLQYFLYLNNPYYWGVINIEDSLINNNQYKVNKIEAILPDGQLIYFEDEDHFKLYHTMPEPKKSIDYQEKTIYLRSTPIEELFLKTKIDIKNVDDFEIVDLKPKIAIGTKQTTNSLPIAKIKYDNDGLLKKINYIPPMTIIDKEFDLYKLCDTLLSNISEKLKILNMTKNRLSTVSKFQFKYLLSARYSLKTALLANNIHPYDIYLSLCNITGLLYSMNEKYVETFPSYEHENLLQTFTDLEKNINEELFKVKVITPETKIFSKNPGKKLFSLHLQNKWLKEGSLIIGVKKKDDNQNISTWMDRCIIGSSEDRVIYDGCDRGADRILLKHDDIEKRDIIIHPGYTYYRIDNRSFHKDNKDIILADETLVIKEFSSDESSGFPEEIILLVQ